MAISANYAQVAEAKRDIDPAHPRSGPGGINAQFDPTVSQSQAVIFGGVPAGVTAPGSSAGQIFSTQSPSTPGASSPRSATPGLGGLLDIST